MRTRKVIVLPYQSSWKKDFQTIKKELLSAVGDLIIGIEHVGSTAVEGLSAKPVIDLDIVIEDYTIFPEVKKGLENIGYTHEGDLGIKDRQAFSYKNKPHLQAHHLYVCPQASSELKRHLKFRNFLRNNKTAVKEYGRVKEEGANLFPDDIDRYIEYKSSCIETLYNQCESI